ncbi:MAG: hypothetical protein DMG70_08495 [Acidobacteria bacterium]|nr:MAG: hypothetical protein DMG70_08495 [Acidobacteriota bacterium]PYY10281.1 MAG: hypothetical protein DMG69_06950 [Acidobacteriota bacterium]
MTNNLRGRGVQHKRQGFERFMHKYNAMRLVYWESFDDVRTATKASKTAPGQEREKKMELILQVLIPDGKDLAADWHEAQSSSTRAEALA